MKKRRADQALYEDMNLESLQLARALIMEGRVMAGDRKILRASETLKEGETLRVRGELHAWVSRGAHKLKKAMDVFGIDLADQICVDVGYNLLDYRLRSDARVVCMERTNARFLKPDDFDPRPTFGATDVSFISLRAVLPAALDVLEGENARFVALVKPQFEAEKHEVGEKGVVRDRAVHEKVLREITGFIPGLGWRVNALDYSPIRGPEGNIEFLLDLVRCNNLTIKPGETSIDITISHAYDNFFKSFGEGL